MAVHDRRGILGGFSWTLLMNSLFGALSIAQKRTSAHGGHHTVLTAIGLIVKWLQILCFIVGIEDGPWTREIIAPIKVASMIPSPMGWYLVLDATGYLTLFSISLAWVVCFIALMTWAMRSFARGNITVLWPLQILASIGMFSATVAYIPLFSLVLSVFQCGDDPHFTFWRDAGYTCFSGGHLALSVVSALLAVAFFALCSLFALVFYDSHPLSTHIGAKAHGRAEFGLIIIKTVLVIVCEIAGWALPSPWIRVGVTMSAGVAGASLILFYMPMTIHWVNTALLSGQCLVIWASMCLAFATSTNDGRYSSVGVYACAPTAVFVAIWLSRWRRATILKTPLSRTWSPFDVELRARYMLSAALHGALAAAAGGSEGDHHDAAADKTAFFSTPRAAGSLSAAKLGTLASPRNSNGAKSDSNAYAVIPMSARSATSARFGAAVSGGAGGYAIKTGSDIIASATTGGGRHLASGNGIASGNHRGAAPLSSSSSSTSSRDNDNVLAAAYLALDLESRASIARERLPAKLLAEVEGFYRSAVLRFPTSAFLHLFQARFYEVFRGSKHLQMSHLLQAQRLGPPLDVAFLSFTARRSAEASAEGDQHVSAMQRVSFEKHMADARRHTVKAAQAQTAFWQELSDAKPDLSALHRISHELGTATAAADICFRELFALAPQNLAAMRLFAQYNLCVINNAEKAAAITAEAERIEEQRSRDHSSHHKSGSHLHLMNELPNDIMADAGASLTVGATSRDLGTILSANTSACKLFGYSHLQLERRNVSMLMPSPFTELHSSMMKRFLSSGEGIMVETCRTVLGRHRNGTMFPMAMLVRADMTPGGLHTFNALFRPLNFQDHYLLCDEDFVIRSGTAGALGCFGLDPADLSTSEVLLTDFVPSTEDEAVADALINKHTGEVVEVLLPAANNINAFGGPSSSRADSEADNGEFGSPPPGSASLPFRGQGTPSAPDAGVTSSYARAYMQVIRAGGATIHLFGFRFLSDTETENVQRRAVRRASMEFGSSAAVAAAAASFALASSRRGDDGKEQPARTRIPFSGSAGSFEAGASANAPQPKLSLGSNADGDAEVDAESVEIDAVMSPSVRFAVASSPSAATSPGLAAASSSAAAAAVGQNLGIYEGINSDVVKPSSTDHHTNSGVSGAHSTSTTAKSRRLSTGSSSNQGSTASDGTSDDAEDDAVTIAIKAPTRISSISTPAAAAAAHASSEGTPRPSMRINVAGRTPVVRSQSQHQHQRRASIMSPAADSRSSFANNSHANTPKPIGGRTSSANSNTPRPTNPAVRSDLQHQQQQMGPRRHSIPCRLNSDSRSESGQSRDSSAGASERHFGKQVVGKLRRMLADTNSRSRLSLGGLRRLWWVGWGLIVLNIGLASVAAALLDDAFLSYSQNLRFASEAGEVAQAMGRVVRRLVELSRFNKGMYPSTLDAEMDARVELARIADTIPVYVSDMYSSVLDEPLEGYFSDEDKQFVSFNGPSLPGGTLTPDQIGAMQQCGLSNGCTGSYFPVSLGDSVRLGTFYPSSLLAFMSKWSSALKQVSQRHVANITEDDPTVQFLIENDREQMPMTLAVDDVIVKAYSLSDETYGSVVSTALWIFIGMGPILAAAICAVVLPILYSIESSRDVIMVRFLDLPPLVVSTMRHAAERRLKQIRSDEEDEEDGASQPDGDDGVGRGGDDDGDGDFESGVDWDTVFQRVSVEFARSERKSAKQLLRHSASKGASKSTAAAASAINAGPYAATTVGTARRHSRGGAHTGSSSSEHHHDVENALAHSGADDDDQTGSGLVPPSIDPQHNDAAIDASTNKPSPISSSSPSSRARFQNAPAAASSSADRGMLCLTLGCAGMRSRPVLSPNGKPSSVLRREFRKSGKSFLRLTAFLTPVVLLFGFYLALYLVTLTKMQEVISLSAYNSVATMRVSVVRKLFAAVLHQVSSQVTRPEMDFIYQGTTLSFVNLYCIEDILAFSLDPHPVETDNNWMPSVNLVNPSGSEARGIPELPSGVWKTINNAMFFDACPFVAQYSTTSINTCRSFNNGILQNGLHGAMNDYLDRLRRVRERRNNAVVLPNATSGIGYLVLNTTVSSSDNGFSSQQIDVEPYSIKDEIFSDDMQIADETRGNYLVPAFDQIARIYSQAGQDTVVWYRAFLRSFVGAFLTIFSAGMILFYLPAIRFVDKDVHAKQAMLLLVPPTVLARLPTLRALVIQLVTEADGNASRSSDAYNAAGTGTQSLERDMGQGGAPGAAATASAAASSAHGLGATYARVDDGQA